MTRNQECFANFIEREIKPADPEPEGERVAPVAILSYEIDVSKRPWLKIAEYTSLTGSLLGTIASALSGQVAYAATPLTLALSLNLINRQQLQQQTQEYASGAIAQAHQALDSLQSQVQTLPIQTENLGSSIRSTIAHLQAQLHAINLHPLKGNIALLQAQVNELKQQQETLSTLTPFDPTVLEQRLSTLEKESQSVFIPHFIAEVKQFQSDRVATEAAIAELAQQLDTLSLRFEQLPVLSESELTRAEAAVTHLAPLGSVSDQLVQLQSDLRSLQEQLPSVERLQQEVEQLGQHVQIVANLSAEMEEFRQQHANAEQLNHLSQQVEAMQTLQATIVHRESLPTLSATDWHELHGAIASEVQTSVQNWATQANQHLAQIRPYNHQLVFDRADSRAALVEALKRTQQRLILVSPWLTRHSMDAQVLWELTSILENRGCIEIGWGCFADIEVSEPMSLSRQEFLAAAAEKNQGWKYEVLPDLEQLELDYPEQFRLKLLGTHEQFLVCDRLFALMGSHDLLSGNANSAERALGLRTDDPRIITTLIDRFDLAPNWEKQAIAPSA